MSDNQRFPMAAHILAYLAHKGARSRDMAISSTYLAASVPTNPVVVRRLIVSLSRAGLLKTCPGAAGGAWLAKDPNHITLDSVLMAVDGFAHIGSVPLGAEGCPISQAIPRAIAKCLTKADQAARKALSETTIMDLLRDDTTKSILWPNYQFLACLVLGRKTRVTTIGIGDGGLLRHRRGLSGNLC